MPEGYTNETNTARKQRENFVKKMSGYYKALEECETELKDSTLFCSQVDIGFTCAAYSELVQLSYEHIKQELLFLHYELSHLPPLGEEGIGS